MGEAAQKAFNQIFIGDGDAHKTEVNGVFHRGDPVGPLGYGWQLLWRCLTESRDTRSHLCAASRSHMQFTLPPTNGRPQLVFSQRFTIYTEVLETASHIDAHVILHEFQGW